MKSFSIQNKKGNKFPLKYLFAFLFWTALWQAAFTLVGEPLFLPSPLMTAKALGILTTEAGFWRALALSLCRITGGFLAAAAVGTVLALTASLWEWVRIVLGPMMSFIRTAPVASFIILLLVWFPSETIALPISFLMVLPVIYVSLLTGLDGVDKELLEAAADFGANQLQQLLWVRFPSAKSFLVTGCETGLGLAFKAGVSAEVIGQSVLTIGGNLYRAKLYLATDRLFALTIGIILASALLEKVILAVLRRQRQGNARGGNE